MKTAWREQLASLVTHPVEWGGSLRRYTSLSIGGPADAVVRVERWHELQPLLAFLAAEKLPWRVLGKGTNVLVKDHGFAGIILLLGTEFATIGERAAKAGGKTLVQVGGGCGLGKLCYSCIDWGLSGLEFCCGIPGTLGGAVIMNAGAWGRDMAAVVRGVTLVTANGEKRLSGEALNFTYRHWPEFERYQGAAVVAGAELELLDAEPAAIKKECQTLQERRKAGQPITLANAGSFFRNPENDSAGRLIEASGLKGTVVGGAMVSEQHGNFLVNRGGASANDFLSLMKLVQERVKNDNGIELEPEVHII